MSDHKQGSPPRRVEKENMAAFIAKKREIFMVQMSLDIKTHEMLRMVQRADQVITEEAVLLEESHSLELGDDL